MLLITLALCGFSQTPTTRQNGSAAPLKNASNQWNGRLWKSFNENEKTAFLMAYVNAIDIVTIIATKGNKESKFSTMFWPGSLTGTEVMAALDKFFDPPENAPTAIVDALMTIAGRSEKISRASIESIVEDPCGTTSKK